MKEQIALSAAGLMLLTAGFENKSGSTSLLSYIGKSSSKTETEKVHDVSEQNIYHQWQGKSSPTLYHGGFYTRADFLYWRADCEGLDSVSWRPGFRVGVGYTFAKKDFWDLMALWTHFKAESTITYNVYDLDLGRDYFISKAVSIRPFLGVRGATIDQRLNKFWGAGAHIGTSMQWHFTKEFSFLGTIGGSLLYGKFKQLDITTGAANLEAMLGFGWEKFFYQNRYRLSVKAGYEWSEWFSQNRRTSHGDLCLQGANLQARWDF